MPLPICVRQSIDVAQYLKEAREMPVLWRVREPIDKREILAHAANIPLADLETVTLSFRTAKVSWADWEAVTPTAEDRTRIYECALLSIPAVKVAQEWYLRQGLWPYSGKRITWNKKITVFLSGYPINVKEQPAGQVNVDRALTTYRMESGWEELVARTEDMCIDE